MNKAVTKSSTATVTPIAQRNPRRSIKAPPSAPSATRGTPIQTTDDPLWIASFRFAMPKSRGHKIGRTEKTRVSKLLTGRFPAVETGDGYIALSFTVESMTPEAAQGEALELFEPILALFNRGWSDVSALHIDNGVLTDVGSEAEVPECVGLSEVASILEVSKQRVYQLTQRTDFPDPIFRLKATPVWLADEIRRFGQGRRRHAE